MANAFARRFMLVVDQLAQGNKKKFAQVTNKSASHVYKICRGASRPSMTYLQYLYDEFKVDLNWLLTGEQSESSQPAGAQPGKELIFAPMFDVQASAGFGSEVSHEDINDYFAFNKSWLSSQLNVSSEQLAFVSISGDSMLPTLNAGDNVLVDMSQTLVNREGIFLLQTEQGLMAKRLKTQGQGDICVTSDNAQYPSWIINSQNEETNRVVGKVVWCARGL
jgi:phage repressor protein C with HTH and peptisase S24 domain